VLFVVLFVLGVLLAAYLETYADPIIAKFLSRRIIMPAVSILAFLIILRYFFR